MPGEVRMYVCGITVYDYCHLGHARMMVVFDMVQALAARERLPRHLRAQHHRHRRQDHPARAQENGEPIDALTARFIRAMDEDCARARRARSPTTSRAPPQYVPQMHAMIEQLREERPRLPVAPTAT